MNRSGMSGRERKGLLNEGPKIWEVYNGLECQHRINRGTHRDIKEAIAIARKFAKEVIRPAYLDIDLKCMADHDYLPWEVVKKAGEYRLFSLFVPKFFGGPGLGFLGIYPFAEEISAACPAMGHIVMVHYCGMATLFPSMNARLIRMVLKDVMKSEREGAPRLCTIVVTEPESGTDVQEPLLVQHARPGSSVKRVEGGWVINGKKIFISSGHLSHWHIANFIEDKKNKPESWLQLVVPNGTPGFSFGAREKKMGQLACPASELLFDDCFVPDSMVSVRSQDKEFTASKKGPRWMCHTVVDHVTASTRTGTAAISTGIGRGAYERALEYARKKTVNGELLVNQQWAQMMLTEMYRNVNVSRAAYMESAFTLALSGLFKLMYLKPVDRLQRVLPRWYFRMIIGPFLNLKVATWLLRKYYYHWYTVEERSASSGWGSTCKIECSDTALANCNIALDLMGVDGLRHEYGVEKSFRDIKKQQIYESTNQVNAINLFYCLVARDMPEVEFCK